MSCLPIASSANSLGRLGIVTWDDSEDLAQLASELRAQIEDAAVRVASVEPTSHRPSDVFFVHPEVSVAALVEMVEAMKPSLVFVTAERFEPADIESEDADLRVAAQGHADDVFRVAVTWPSDGLLFTWFVTAGWHDELVSETEIAEYQAQGLDQVERELRFERARSSSGSLMALILASPEFRAATTNRRTAQMKLIMGAHPELVEDLLFQRDFEIRVRTEAATAVARWEQELSADESVVPRLAEEILGLRTQRDLKARAADAVREMADGWSLTDGFVELVLARAKDYNGR